MMLLPGRMKLTVHALPALLAALAVMGCQDDAPVGDPSLPSANPDSVEKSMIVPAQAAGIPEHFRLNYGIDGMDYGLEFDLGDIDEPVRSVWMEYMPDSSRVLVAVRGRVMVDGQDTGYRAQVFAKIEQDKDDRGESYGNAIRRFLEHETGKKVHYRYIHRHRILEFTGISREEADPLLRMIGSYVGVESPYLNREYFYELCHKRGVELHDYDSSTEPAGNPE